MDPQQQMALMLQMQQNPQLMQQMMAAMLGQAQQQAPQAVAVVGQQPMGATFAVGAPAAVAPTAVQASYGAPQPGVIPAMDASELLGSLQAQATGIGAAQLPTDRLKPPLPKDCVRDFTLPPEQENIVKGLESISYVKFTGGLPRSKRSGGGFLMAKGTLLQTTGDSPVGSEVGFPIWPGDYYLRDLKQLFVAAFHLQGPQLTNEPLLHGLIANCFGSGPGQQMLVDKIIGCKTFVGTAKKSGKKGLRWIAFRALQVQTPTGGIDFRPVNG